VYHMVPNNKDVETFAMSAFHWPLLLEQCGTYFAAVFDRKRWFYVSSVDERMGDSEEGPALILNSGFPITEEEAKVLARIARNYVAMQRLLDLQKRDPIFPAIKLQLLDLFETFADWAETSGGFRIT